MEQGKIENKKQSKIQNIGKNKRQSKGQSKKISKLKIILLILLIIIIIFMQIRAKSSSNTIEQSASEIIKEEDALVNKESSFPANVFGVNVYTELIDVNTKARPGIKRKIKYIVIHETDNFESGVGAKNHAKFLKANNTKSTSWHYTVDDTEIYHHIPDNEIAYHAADEDGNEHGIGIELCVNKDGNFEKTFENAAKLVAFLLKEYNLTIDDIKTHHDFSGKDCPHSILKNNRMGELKKEVEKYYCD